MLTGKTVILGVTGSIAAYKAASLCSMLVRNHCSVHVIMTKNAENFIHPLTFETLTKHKCLTDTFDRNFRYEVEHVSLGKLADFALVAPASANIIGKMANGIADDMLSTTLLACRCPVAVAPAMNTAMYENPAVQENLRRLREYGVKVIEPDSGRLACGDEGKGKLPSEDFLFSCIAQEIQCEKDLQGRKILVTAGPTRESLDPVRFLTNRSTGKMGYAIARAASLRGAEVTLVSGPVSIREPDFVRTIRTETAQEMYQAVMAEKESQDAFILSAAVADYAPERFSEQKIKKSEDSLVLPLRKTRDILEALGREKKADQVLCGFAMETENLLENATEKLKRKNADLICANCLLTEGAGFASDTNVLTMLTKDGAQPLPKMSKDECAHAILDWIRDEIRHRMPSAPVAGR